MLITCPKDSNENLYLSFPLGYLTDVGKPAPLSTGPGPRLCGDEESKFCPHYGRFSRAGKRVRACACRTRAECDSRCQIKGQAGKSGR